MEETKHNYTPLYHPFEGWIGDFMILSPKIPIRVSHGLHKLRKVYGFTNLGVGNNLLFSTKDEDPILGFLFLEYGSREGEEVLFTYE